jgi:branched-subunit amino acid aminotransferase/4-amino-4-deoxychorismate lyase
MMAPNLELPILGTKNGAWQYYIDAREQAAIHGADIALLFLDNFLIDGDKCTPIILDHDGVAYHPKNTDGALDSITLEQIKEGIEISGIPVRGAKISLDMLFRASEMIVLGSGLGVCSLGKIDGRKIGNPKGKLYKAAKETWIQRLKSGWLGFDDLEG